ncbi:zinc finger protein 3 homolog [Ochlerotatus camptorhynchus]|uniref:zinc finger protein 3 homolog n=1 Tax=Ochlerotatus camptorhynchus TaxID=644619 RepID=UPI0031E1748A
MAVAAWEIKKEKSPDSICRLCFTEGESYRLIFDDEYSSLHEWIENLTSLKIMRVPSAPASLCLECEKTLQNFESFREMCFTNDRVIKEMFTHDDSSNEHADLSEAMPVIYEITSDQRQDQQNYMLSPTIDSQVDNTEITIEYQNIKIEVSSSTNSEENYYEKDVNESIIDTKEVLELAKSESHVKTVTIEKKTHICSLCGKGFTNSNRLKIHIRSHTQERPHKCKDCGKSFITPSNLKRHMRAHSGLKPYSCDRCESKYSQSSHLVRHKRAHLRKDLMNTKNGTEENESGRDTEESEKNNSLLELMKANDKSKQHCTICNKFVLKLTDHQLIHKEISPYQCKYCPKGFNQINKLTMHTRTHTKEKPYVCIQCDKSFRNSGDLKVHIRSHTQERPFKCKECKKSFISISHLMRHNKTHSGLKPYSCDICQAKFSQNSHLSRHKQVHHKSTTMTAEASVSNRDAKEDQKI